jgi:hypothetical protein
MSDLVGRGSTYYCVETKNNCVEEEERNATKELFFSCVGERSGLKPSKRHQ